MVSFVVYMSGSLYFCDYTWFLCAYHAVFMYIVTLYQVF